MPLCKDIVNTSTRVLVWRIDETVQELLALLGCEVAELPNNQQRKLEKLAVYCMMQHLGLHFPYSYDPSGRPVVGNGVNISISHSYSYAALAVSKHCAVGIDIERINRNFARVASKYLTQSESRRAPSQEELALLWCAKEAVYKLPWDKPLDFSRDIEVGVAEMTSGVGFVDVWVNSCGVMTELRLNVEMFDGYALVWGGFGSHQ